MVNKNRNLQPRFADATKRAAKHIKTHTRAAGPSFYNTSANFMYEFTMDQKQPFKSSEENQLASLNN